MDYEGIKLTLTVINMLATSAIWVFVWLDSRRRVTVSSIESLESSVTKRFEAKCLRISKLEAELRAVPTKEDIIRIHERLDETVKDSRTMVLLMGEISGQIKQMNEGHK